MNNIKYQNRRLLFILATVGLWLNVIMFIPFGKTFGEVENIIKFIALPIVILALNLVISLKKFSEYRPTNRLQSYASYLPMFGYFVSTFAYLIFMTNRAKPDAVFSYNVYLFMMVTFALISVAFVCLQFTMDKVNLSLTKNQVNVIDVVVYLAFILDLVLLRFVVLKDYTDITLDNSSAGNIIVGIVIGAAVLTLMFLRLVYFYKSNEEFVAHDRNELLNHWQNLHDEAYSNAELMILYSLNNYTDERFVVNSNQVTVEEGTVVVDEDELAKLQSEVKVLKDDRNVANAKYKKVREELTTLQNQVKLDVAKTELEGLKKQLEVLDESINEETTRVNDDVSQYEDEKAAFEETVKQFNLDRDEYLKTIGFESIAAAKAHEEAELAAKAERQAALAKPKAEKVFKPSYDEMLGFAKHAEGEDLSVVVNASNTQHKFMVGKKPYLIMQKTNNYYRLTFCVKEEDILTYLQNYPGVIAVAKSPKSANFLTISNTGELDEELLKKIISESLPAEIATEEAIEAKKAEEQAKAAAKKAEEDERKALADWAVKEQKRQERERIKAEKAAARKAEREALAAAKAAEKEAAKKAEQEAKAAEKEAASNNESKEGNEAA